jgi:hypothetical protein
MAKRRESAGIVIPATAANISPAEAAKPLTPPEFPVSDEMIAMGKAINSNHSLDQRDSQRIAAPIIFNGPIRYEYRSIQLSASVQDHDNGINVGCSNGWELFQVYNVVESRPRMMGETVFSRTMALFRRPKHDEPGIS